MRFYHQSLGCENYFSGLVQTKSVSRFNNDFAVFGFDRKSRRRFPLIGDGQFDFLVNVPFQKARAVSLAVAFFGQ